MTPLPSRPTATGSDYGLNMESRAVSTIKGNLTTLEKKYDRLQSMEPAQLTVTNNLESKEEKGFSYQCGAELYKYAKVLVKGNTTLSGNKKSSYGDGLLM
ncbi:MAG: hypothetical protein AB2989_04215 [Candidatus Symbiodolus clandestinus]